MLEKEGKIRIAIGAPKGSLEKCFDELIQRTGLVPEWKGYQGYVDTGNCVELMFHRLRPQDIPRYISRGDLDIGVIGQDCLRESGFKRVIEITPLPFTRAGTKRSVKVVLFVRQDSQICSPRDISKTTKIATEYPKIAKKYLRKLGIKAVIELSHGATESIVRAGFADAGIDIVDGGNTILENDLKEIDEVMKSITVLVANPRAVADSNKGKVIEKLKTLLLEALEAT